MKTYRNIEIKDASFNGMYSFGATPYGEVTNKALGDVVVAGAGVERFSAIECTRVYSINETEATIALVIDLTQLLGFKPKGENNRFLGRVTLLVHNGQANTEPGDSWVTEGTFSQLQDLFTCQQTLTDLAKAGKLVFDGEVAQSCYFESGAFRGIKLSEAESLGLTPEQYPYHGAVRFSLVSSGHGLITVASAHNPASERDFIAVLSAEPNEGDTYDGPLGVILAGLHGFGATGTPNGKSTFRGIDLKAAKTKNVVKDAEPAKKEGDDIMTEMPY